MDIEPMKTAHNSEQEQCGFAGCESVSYPLLLL